MDEEQFTEDARRFHQLIKEFLLPLFPGAEPIEYISPPPNSRRLAVQDGPQTKLRIKPWQDAGFAFVIKRSQNFTDSDRLIFSAFSEEMGKVLGAWDDSVWQGHARARMASVVAKSINLDISSSVAKVIEILENWAEQTYEGQRITCAVGICMQGGEPSLPIELWQKKDFAKVLSNGIDTIVIFDQQGNFVDHTTCGPALDDVLCPTSYSHLCAWAEGAKALACLTRNGEILLFAKQKLLFAKRRGAWRYFDYEIIVQQVASGAGRSWSQDVRTAAFQTALDVSFARTGGCIGLLRAGEEQNLEDLVDKEDILATSESPKAKFLRQSMTPSHMFQEIDRRLRQDLAALDGAIVLTHDGRSLTYGAILGVGGGSPGGGRRAAAHVLGKRGIGIKISNDGMVECFDGDEEPFLRFG